MAPDNEPYVLLAEDNFPEVNLFQIALREAKIEAPLKIVNTGPEVLDFLHARGVYAYRNPAHFPQLLILDLNLPMLSGIDVLDVLRADSRFSDLPIIIFTSSERSKDNREAIAHGANDFLKKPIDFPDFLNSVKEMYDRWVN
ncbi:MAG: response regulator [Bacteroidia bacterium]